jgi:hypothetical protein
VSNRCAGGEGNEREKEEAREGEGVNVFSIDTVQVLGKRGKEEDESWAECS